MKRAVTPGTFDPLTNGHLDIIERASCLFDEVVVAVASSEKKHPLFSLEERLALAKEATSHLDNVIVAPINGLLVDFARLYEATVLVKGLRATTDFEYEFAMTAANYHLDEGIETLFMMAAPSNMYLSSSLVREIASFGTPVDDFVPPCAARALKRKFSPSNTSIDEHYAHMKVENGYNSMCKMAIPEGLNGKTVLDVGCRRGKGAYRLSEQVGKDGHVIGVDWVSDYIDEARLGAERAMRKSGLPVNNMEFRVGYPEDLASVGIEDGSIDVVWVNCVHNLFFDPRIAFQECARVMKPGGMLVCETVYSDAPRDETVVQQARKLGNSIQSCGTRTAFEEMLADAGFASIRLEDECPVAPTLGFKEDHEVPVAFSNEEVSFVSAVAYASKPLV